MGPNFPKIAGWLLMLGSLQFFLCMLLAESLYPNYSRANNYISDLGVGSTASLFNSSIMLAGIAALLSALLLSLSSSRLFPFLLAISGIGAIGVGIFPEDAGFLHILSAGLAFAFGAFAAIASSRACSGNLGRASIALGSLSLLSLLLFVSGTTLGIGIGAIERAVAYPYLLWAILFGWHLACCQNSCRQKKE